MIAESIFYGMIISLAFFVISFTGIAVVEIFKIKLKIKPLLYLLFYLSEFLFFMYAILEVI